MAFWTPLGLALRILVGHTTLGPIPASSLLEAPSTPKTLERCVNPLAPAPSPGHVGEHLTYTLKLLGLPLGTVTIATWRQGRYQGEPVTEYRAWIEPEPLVTTFVDLEAQAFALVPLRASTSVRSLTRYRFQNDRVEESQARRHGGRSLTAERTKNGRTETTRREFAQPIHDYLTAFMMLRELPPNRSGCTVVFADKRAYTVWIEAQGTTSLNIKGKAQRFARYTLRYGSDRSNTVRQATVWMTLGKHPVPYRAESTAAFSPVVRLTRHIGGRR